MRDSLDVSHQILHDLGHDSVPETQRGHECLPLEALGIFLVATGMLLWALYSTKYVLFSHTDSWVTCSDIR